MASSGAPFCEVHPTYPSLSACELLEPALVSELRADVNLDPFTLHFSTSKGGGRETAVQGKPRGRVQVGVATETDWAWLGTNGATPVAIAVLKVRVLDIKITVSFLPQKSTSRTRCGLQVLRRGLCKEGKR